MSIRISATCLMAGLVLVILVLSTITVGCSSDGTDPITTTATTGVTPGTSATETTEDSTATTGSMLSEWDRQLRDNAKVQHNLAVYLDNTEAADDDPMMGMYYGLQARTRALTCRKALVDDDLELANTSMLEVYYALNLARSVATGSVAGTLTDAHAIIETLGAPSDNPTEATALLDQFLEATAPLVDEADSVLSSTTTT